MKTNLNALSAQPIVSWHCGCNAGGPDLPITVPTCPECGKPMPQDVRRGIYEQVKKELQSELQHERAIRQKRILWVIGRVLPFLIAGLILLGIIGLRIYMPDLFRPMEAWAADAWQWLLALPALIGTGLGDIWNWLCGAFGAAGDFLMPLLGGAGELLGGLWNVVCAVAVFLWDLLLTLIAGLPEFLGLLWSVLGLLANQVWNLVLFIFEAVPAIFALALGLIMALVQVIGSLLGFLWELITGIFSLFF